MQLALAMLVALSQVAGPWLCCCGPARLFAATPSRVVVGDPEPVVGCPHCKVVHPEPAKSAPKHPASCPDDHAPDRCPCDGSAYQQLQALASETGPDLRYETATPTTTFAIAVVLLLPGLPDDVEATPGLSDLPFMPTAHRLFVHHALRC